MDENGDGIGQGRGDVKTRKKPHKRCRRDQALYIRTHHHLCRQGLAFSGTRQLHCQGSVSVYAHRAEGITGFEGLEGRKRVGGAIGVGGADRDGNGVSGGNGDVNVDGDEDGAGTRTGVGGERRDARWEQGRERGRGRGGVGNGNGGGTGAGLETRAVVEMGTGTRIGTGSRRVEEGRRSATNRTKIVGAMWETDET